MERALSVASSRGAPSTETRREWSWDERSFAANGSDVPLAHEPKSEPRAGLARVRTEPSRRGTWAAWQILGELDAILTATGGLRVVATGLAFEQPLIRIAEEIDDAAERALQAAGRIFSNAG